MEIFGRANTFLFQANTVTIIVQLQIHTGTVAKIKPIYYYCIRY